MSAYFVGIGQLFLSHETKMKLALISVMILGLLDICYAHSFISGLLHFEF